MVFLNYKSLPWYWLGFDDPAVALLIVVLVPGLLALAFGFRSRVSGVYLSIIRQALIYALLLAFFRNDMGLGGNNGLTDFKDIFGLDLHADRVRVILLLSSAVAPAAALGAVLVNVGRTLLTGALPELWLFALGAVFILVTLLLPGGIMGLPRRPIRRRKPALVTPEVAE